MTHADHEAEVLGLHEIDIPCEYSLHDRLGHMAAAEYAVWTVAFCEHAPPSGRRELVFYCGQCFEWRQERDWQAVRHEGIECPTLNQLLVRFERIGWSLRERSAG